MGKIIRKLNCNDAEFCNNLWIFKNEQSECWLRSLLEIYGGYALVDERSEEILSFALITGQFAIGCLTTIKTARRKGYGELIAKYLAKELASRNILPLAFIANDNQNSINLFTKLGFTRIGDCNWIVMSGE